MDELLSLESICDRRDAYRNRCEILQRLSLLFSEMTFGSFVEKTGKNINSSFLYQRRKRVALNQTVRSINVQVIAEK